MRIYIVIDLENWDAQSFTTMKHLCNDYGLSYRMMLDHFKKNAKRISWPYIIIQTQLNKS